MERPSDHQWRKAVRADRAFIATSSAYRLLASGLTSPSLDELCP